MAKNKRNNPSHKNAADIGEWRARKGNKARLNRSVRRRVKTILKNCPLTD